jgi:hypothetical protein
MIIAYTSVTYLTGQRGSSCGVELRHIAQAFGHILDALLRALPANLLRVCGPAELFLQRQQRGISYMPLTIIPTKVEKTM